MALIYLGYRALKKKMGDGEDEKELTEEEQAEQLAQPVERSKATSVGGAAGGAAVGTMIMPGVGTAIGAGVGALIGSKKSKSDQLKKQESNKRELEKLNERRRLESQSSHLYDKLDVIIVRYDSSIGIHLKESDKGVYVSKVVEKSPAFEAGVLVGDILLSVDKASVTGKSVNAVVEILKQTKSEILFGLKRIKAEKQKESEKVTKDDSIENILEKPE